MIKSALADSTIFCWQQTQTSDNALKKSYVTKFNRGGNFNKEKEAESGGNLTYPQLNAEALLRTTYNAKHHKSKNVNQLYG